MFCISSLSRPEPYPARISSVSIRMDQTRTGYGSNKNTVLNLRLSVIRITVFLRCQSGYLLK